VFQHGTAFHPVARTWRLTQQSTTLPESKVVVTSVIDVYGLVPAECDERFRQGRTMGLQTTWSRTARPRLDHQTWLSHA
jgi:hypothetical protein